MILPWTCALLLTPSLAFQGPSALEPASLEEPSDSLTLQHRADSLGIDIDGFLRATRLDSTGNSPVSDAALGTKIDHARLRFTGENDDFAWRIGVDALNSPDGLSLQDAWISLNAPYDTRVTLGNFRPPFITSGLLDADRLLFPIRARNGIFYSVRTPGVQAEGASGDLGWSVAVQDGVLDPSDPLGTLRVTYDFTGLGALPWEGALRSDFKSRFWAALAVSKENSLDSDLARALELHYVDGRYSLALEWLGYGSDYDREEGVGPWSPNIDGANSVFGERRGGTHPLSITATYMFVPDLVELAVRWEDLDDVRGDGAFSSGSPVAADADFDRRKLFIGLNYYVKGHDMKFHLAQVQESRDGIDDSDDFTVWGLGMSLSF